VNRASTEADGGIRASGNVSMSKSGQALARARGGLQDVLEPGRTCWRIERADRFGIIIDAADYFAEAKKAMLNARRIIMLIGWDFDLRIRLNPADGEDPWPDRLGPFLKALVRRRPELQVFILKWDAAVLYAPGRQILPVLALDLWSRGRIHLRLDSQHPPMAAHHQKIVVIDDSLAFCGGIDMTDDRWDTRRHGPGDPHRVRPDGSPFGPWHDATALVDGPAARALGELARQRWGAATGKRLPPPQPDRGLWPEGLEPLCENVDVGIARTMPELGERKKIDEIEKLTLAAIAAARRTIYIESQYFASSGICEALATRLREEDGPEVVVINPISAEGWLESTLMGAARNICLQRIVDADRHHRFHIYHPVNEAGEPIYVHAKILIIDDAILRIGSSNLNNRSMGFDTECDLVVEARRSPDPDAAARAIARLRGDLLAEHLGTAPEQVSDAVTEHGSFGRAIEALRRKGGRSLRPIEPEEVSPIERDLVASRIGDPEKPGPPRRRFTHLFRRLALRLPEGKIEAALLGLLAGAVLGVLLAMVWRRDGRRAQASLGRAMWQRPWRGG
jgi:phospholipase D1/2